MSVFEFDVSCIAKVIAELKQELQSVNRGERLAKTAKRLYPDWNPEYTVLLTQFQVSSSPEEITKVYTSVAHSCMRGNPAIGGIALLRNVDGQAPVVVLHDERCRVIVRQDTLRYLKAYGPYAGKVEGALRLLGYEEGSEDFWDGLHIPEVFGQPVTREVVKEITYYRVEFETYDRPSKRGWHWYSLLVESCERTPDGWYRVVGTKASGDLPGARSGWSPTFRNANVASLRKWIKVAEVKEFTPRFHTGPVYLDGIGNTTMSSFLKMSSPGLEDDPETQWDDVWARMAG